jgi:hypothetical protein
MHASPKREEPMSERKPFFAEAVAFAAESPVLVDWLLEGAAPLDLAMSLGCGVDWLGMRVARRVRAALVSREDHDSQPCAPHSCVGRAGNTAQ